MGISLCVRRQGRSVSVAAVFAVCLGVGAASAAHADRYEVSVGSAARWMSFGSVDALTDQGMGAFSAAGAIELQQVSIPGLELLVDSTIEIGGFSGTTFQRIESDAMVYSGSIGARARRQIAKRWTAGARFGLGLARVDLAIRDAFSDSLELKDRGYTGTAYLGAGLDYTPIRRRDDSGADRFALGVRAELGYLSMIPIDMDGNPNRMDEDGAIHIPSEATSLGGLNLSALSLRIALVSRF